MNDNLTYVISISEVAMVQERDSIYKTPTSYIVTSCSYTIESTFNYVSINVHHFSLYR